jgi:hypothetical protein
VRSLHDHELRDIAEHLFFEDLVHFASLITGNARISVYRKR